jgi:VCBS repeat-containing protein
VTGVNDAPLADNDQIVVRKDANVVDVTEQLLDGDMDLDAGDQILILGVFFTGMKGLIRISGDGRITYQPGPAFESLKADETATDLFRYQIRDQFGATSEAEVKITVVGEPRDSLAA